MQLAHAPCCTAPAAVQAVGTFPAHAPRCPARQSTPPVQLDNLTGLQHLALCDCGMSDESMQQLAALPLQDLDLANSCLPPCLSALTGLTSLAIMQHDAEDLDMLDASLPCLTGLSRLALTTVTDAVEQLPACLPQLRSITRFCLVGDWQADIFLEDAMPRGAWVARLRWLVSWAGLAGKRPYVPCMHATPALFQRCLACSAARLCLARTQYTAVAGRKLLSLLQRQVCLQACLPVHAASDAICPTIPVLVHPPFLQGLPYHMAAAAAAAGVLSRAALLDYLCSSGWPEKAAAEDGAQQQEEDGRWEAFWNFLARHPPLRCFAVDTNLIEGSSSKPNDAAVDALLDMHWRRPGLQLRRLPRYAGSQTFWDELLECEEIPEGAGAP